MVFKRPPCPGSPYQTAPVQLQAGRGQSLARPRPSSSQETAGRAGRARQAAQEKPCLVPPLPPRGPGDKEARGSPERRQPARVPTPARGSSDPAVQSRVRAELPAAAGRGRVHRQPGGGRRRVGRAPGGEAGEGRAGGGGANERLPAALPAATWGAAEARPRHGATTGGAGLPRRSATALLSLASRRARIAALSIRARRQQLVRARSARLARRGSLRSPRNGGHRLAGARPSGHPSSGLVRRITQRFARKLHSEPGNSVCAAQPGVIASVQMGGRRLQELVPPGCPPWSPGKQQAPRTFNTFAFALWSRVLP